MAVSLCCTETSLAGWVAGFITVCLETCYLGSVASRAFASGGVVQCNLKAASITSIISMTSNDRAAPRPKHMRTAREGEWAMRGRLLSRSARALVRKTEEKEGGSGKRRVGGSEKQKAREERGGGGGW